MDATTEGEFVEFVAHRTHALLRVAYSLTGDQHAAEDLVQTALAKAFVRWRSIRGEAEPYVKRIIYNDSASRWRRRAHRVESATAEPPDGPAEFDRVEQTHLRLMLREALLTLPPRQRAVLVLRYLEDMSVEETAEVLGCRPGTVASQTSRALAKLREHGPALSGLSEAGTGMLR